MDVDDTPDERVEQNTRQWHARIPYPEHEDRCQGSGPNGQCQFFRISGSTFCHQHDGGRTEQKERKQEVHAYRLSKYQARVDEFATDPEALKLRGEIGILRMTLERTLNRCKTDEELSMSSTRISVMLGQLQKLIESSARLESRLGQLLDRGTLNALCDKIIHIITEHVHPDKLSAVADAIAGAIASATSKSLEAQEQ